MLERVHTMRHVNRLVLLIAIAGLLPSAADARKTKRRPMRFVATANSVEGITAKGTIARDGIVAADPKVLPLGSRIRVTGAGPYSGTYTVTDTGPKVTGRHIDLYLPSNAEAKRFGKKRVTVRVLRYGDNQRNGREATPAKTARPRG
jgi:3D (Asp-Asp-Asp) domain-containing protein